MKSSKGWLKCQAPAIYVGDPGRGADFRASGICRGEIGVAALDKDPRESSSFPDAAILSHQELHIIPWALLF